ncbi:MAG TPA: hypothetical protein PKH07_01360, partial [bacterium]|nr:hypothetical protein [bacterium]
MDNTRSRATLSRGRQSWCVIFRHPLCFAPDGKQKLRVRRGLSTPDEKRAKELVEQLNRILSDQSWWNLASREKAERFFDRKIVAAFYDPMSPSESDSWAVREEVIPMPGGRNPSDGYKRVLFVGTTGAGKTTIVRQLLGTDPKRERFPSISAAKTTTCDIEIVLAEGLFRAVVTFIPRDRVRQYIVECVLAAVYAKLEDAPRSDLFRRFLEHSEQRFRLSYILGNPTLLERELADKHDDEEEDLESETETNVEIAESERRELLANLNGYFETIGLLAEETRLVMQETAIKMGIDMSNASDEEREDLRNQAEEQLGDFDAFHELVDSVLDDVETRFEQLPEEEISRGRDGWPVKWSYTDSERSSFIETVNKF